MIDSLVKAVEKFTQLLEYRAKRRRLEYDDFIKPAYEAMLNVHLDHMRMLSESRNAAQTSGTDLAAYARTVLHQRLLAEPVSAALRQQVKAYGQALKGSDYTRFFEVIDLYLAFNDDFWAAAHPTGSTSLLTMFTEVGETTWLPGANLGEPEIESYEGAARATLVSMTDSGLYFMRQYWDVIASTNASLKLRQ